MSEQNNVTQLATIQQVEFNPPALVGDFVQAMAEEGIDPTAVDPERIPWPTGGTPFFTVDGEAVKELQFVNIFDHNCNGWWKEKKSKSGENQPPTCQSFDTITGHGEIGDGRTERPCATCPLNQYGTGTDEAGNPTKGKACKNMRRIFGLFEDSIFPKVITLPPTSLKEFNTFKANKIVGKQLRSYQVITGIALKTETKNGNPVALIVPRIVGMATPEVAAKAKAFSEQWKEKFQSVSIESTDYAENGHSQTPDLNSMDFDNEAAM